MSERLRGFIGRHRLSVETALNEFLPLSGQSHAARLNDALRYALFPGGKRWRPMLAMLGAEAIGARSSDALAAGCAMEFLHTSSIILDDLPAMDDADMRRGRRSLHVVYGESVALLAALALLNESYGMLIRAARENGFCEHGLKLVQEATGCIGSNGMIGGQIVDLALQGAGQHPESLASRNLKTTALMKLTLMAGALVCGAEEDDAAALGEFGESLGMAYQICDDLLDELGTIDELGKPVKQDSRHCRSNFAAELGVEGAHRLATSMIEDGKSSLRIRFGDRWPVELLGDAADLILEGAGRLKLATA